MRSSRLMALLMLCRTRERWTAAELARELEVSVRTIYRDVGSLQGAGVPLWTETGPGGGIRLLPGWTSQLDALSGDEAAALSLSGVPGAADELGLGVVAMSAQLKVRAALPPELQARANRIEERFHLDAPGWFHRPDATDQLPVVAEAVWSSRRIDITYRRSDRTIRRRLDPLGIVLKAGTWYLVARHRSSIRTYRVGRIIGCTLRDGTFDRPEPFELSSWWANSSAEFDRSLLRYPSSLRLSPAACRRLDRVVGTTAARAALEDATDPDEHGWRLVELVGESEHVLADQLLQLGAEVQVIAPPSLRERLRAVGVAIAELHQDDHSDHLSTYS